MKIKCPASAGTMESSDCMVLVEPGEGNVELSLDSVVINQFGNQIRRVVLDTLNNLEIDNVKLRVIDKGALDCTIRARVEAAIFRACGQPTTYPWGGVLQ